MSREVLVRWTCDTLGCDQTLEAAHASVAEENDALDEASWGRVSNGSQMSFLCGAHMADFRKFFPEPEVAS